LDRVAAAAWLATPKERTMAYYSFFAPVARRVQRCLRLWIPYIRCQRRQLFGNQDDGYALIVYRATKPFARSSRPDFTYDPMNRKSVSKACRSARRAVTEKLSAIELHLRRSGLQQAADLYKPSAAERALARAEYGNRTFLNLLVADGVAVEMLRKLGARGRGIRLRIAESPPAPVRNLIQAAKDSVRVFRTRFKRLSRDEELAALGSLLMLEASAAASEHLGRGTPLCVTVRLEDAASGSRDGAILLHASTRATAGEPV
jgi:hypothetical protein